MGDAYEFYQEDSEDVEYAADAGYGTQCWFREIKKFDNIAEAPETGVVAGETRIITGTHTFKEDGDGFIVGSGHQDGGKMEGASVGEPGAQGLLPYTFSIFFVGDTPAVREKAENMRNRAFILLFKDPNCQDTRILQLGCKCDPALTSVKFESGERKKGGMKGYTVTFTSTCWFDYQGDITEKDAELLPVPEIAYDDPNMAWSGSDSEYELQFDTVNTFASPTIFYHVTGNTFDPTQIPLAPGTYYFRIRNVHEDTTWSNIAPYTVS